MTKQVEACGKSSQYFELCTQQYKPMYVSVFLNKYKENYLKFEEKSPVDAFEVDHA
jgi:hypothetical protein